MRRTFLLILIALLLFGCAQQEQKDTLPTTAQNINHAGDDIMPSFRITSTAFSEGQPIPMVYTCQGEDTSPPLRIEGVPTGTKSLALVMDDPDAPVGVWDHWVVWNIDPSTTEIKERSTPAGATQGRNSWGMSRYGGPCPPSGTHRYVFTLYALDTALDLTAAAGKRDLERAMQEHILTKTQLIGTYKKT
jgi:hypothetical protein